MQWLLRYSILLRYVMEMRYDQCPKLLNEFDQADNSMATAVTYPIAVGDGNCSMTRGECLGLTNDSGRYFSD